MAMPAATPDEGPSFFEALLDASPDLIFFKDADGVYRIINTAAAAMLDLPREAILGRDDFALFPEAVARQHREADRQALAAGIPTVFEYEMITTQGRAVWLQMLKSPVRGPDGQLAGVFCTGRNITGAKSDESTGRQVRLALEERVADRTNRLRRVNAKLRLQIEERHKAEQALAESVRTLNLILDNSPIGISLVVERTVRWANPRFHELFAMAPGSIADTSTASFYPDHHAFEEFGQLHYPRLSRGERVDVVWTMRRSDGTEFLCRIIGQLLHAARPHEGSIWLMEDVTERRMAEEAVLAADRLKREFMDTMSHEIRTPLNGIQGMAALLAATPLSEEQQAYLQDLQTATATLAGLLENMLDFSRLDSGAADKLCAPFSPRAIMAGVVQSMTGPAQHKGLSLTWEVDSTVPERVLGDAGGIRRVLTALVSNALKFTEQGRVSLTVACREAACDPALDPEGRTRLELAFGVRDTGIGMTPQQLRCIFEPFRQADGSRTRRFGGAGLGLALARQTAMAMDGEIAAESEPGRGSTFTFTVALRLPLGPNACDNG